MSKSLNLTTIQPCGISRFLTTFVLLITTALPLHLLPHRAYAIDSDHDGMSDVWQRIYHVPSSEAEFDPDGDGMTNLKESIFRTHPRANSSVTQIGVQIRPEGPELSWDSQPGVRYSLQSSDDLLNWPAYDQPLTGDGSPLSKCISGLSGQRKYFRVQAISSLDTDLDGLDEWEEAMIGTDQSKSDSDYDGLNDGSEFLAGTDPLDYYNGAKPSLSIISGDDQSGFPAELIQFPMNVQLLDGNGANLAGEPLIFEIIQGGGALVGHPNGEESPSQLIIDSNAIGQALASFRFPSENVGDSKVRVRMGRVGSPEVMFSLHALKRLKSPTIIPSSGQFTEAQTVIFSGGEPGSEIFFTTDGSQPNLASQKYDSNHPLIISKGTTLLARAYKNGCFSQSTKAEFKFAYAQLAGGRFHSLLLRNGTVHAWGKNELGQLGNETVTSHHLPTPVPLLNPIDSITAGGDFSHAREANGTTWSWGFGLHGTIGDGFSLNRSLPVKVLSQNQTPQLLKTMSAGLGAFSSDQSPSVHSLAVTLSGAVVSWGTNKYGDLGIGTMSETAVTYPGLIGLSNIKLVAAGSNQSIALETSGQLWSWGSNLTGALGNGTFAGRSTPFPFSLPGGVAATGVGAGHEHSAALGADGNVYRWGHTNAGHLAITGPDIENNAQPTLVPGLSGVTSISVGMFHTLALKNDGTVWAWGRGGITPGSVNGGPGQLGNGSTSDERNPTKVLGLPSIVGISAGGFHSLALDAYGRVWAWGDNKFGQLGLDPLQVPFTTVPLLVSALSPSSPFPDDDNDGLVDSFELENFGDLAQGAGGDYDGDRVTNEGEQAQNTNPSVPNGEPLGSVSGRLVGTAHGSFSVTPGGAATYTLPIECPQGSGGLTPQLSLNYSSLGENGDMGVGWTLGGLSAITRGPLNKAEDGSLDPVDYDGNDVFYLDGQRLVAISGAYGGNGTEYRTEIDSFARIISYDDENGGPKWFRVWTKTGTIMSYGSWANSRQKLVQTNGVTVWLVDRIEDRNENFISVHYHAYNEGDPSTRDYKPLAIAYGANKTRATFGVIRFDYEDRPDRQQGYLAGGVICNCRRVKSISTYLSGDAFASDGTSVGGNTIFRRYGFSYELSSTTGRSLLREVSMTLPYGDTLPPLNFGYGKASPLPEGLAWREDNSYSMPVPMRTENSPDQGVRFADVNGDGRVDILQAMRDALGEFSTVRTWLNRSNRVTTQTGVSGAWEESSSYLPPVKFVQKALDSFGNISWDSTGTALVDINGDHLVDIIQLFVGRGPGSVLKKAYLNDGQSGWIENATLAGALPDMPITDLNYGGDNGVRLADLNGDGIIDFVGNYHTHGPQAAISRTTTNGIVWDNSPEFLPRADQPFAENAVASTGTYLLDINGDTLPDIIRGYNAPGAGAPTYTTTLNNGTGWTVSNSYQPPHPFFTLGLTVVPQVRFADLNGDGLVDMLYGGVTGANSTFLNTGAGWVLSAEFAPPIGFDYPTQNGVQITDVNGDGLPDFMTWSNAVPNSPHRTWLNTGSGWRETDDSSVWSPLPIEQLEFQDVNGDGVAYALMAGDPANNYAHDRCWIQSKVGFDRLLTLTDGLGAQTRVQYQLLTDAGQDPAKPFYTRQVPPPALTVNPPPPPPADTFTYTPTLFAVKSYAVDNGIGDTALRSFRYGEMRAHGSGYGSLGFRWVQALDEQTGNSVSTFYRQDRPFSGEAWLVEVRTANGTLIESTETDWGKRTGYVVGVPQNPVHLLSPQFAFPRESVKKTYELDGTPVTTTITTNVYDNFGNPTDITVNYGAGHLQTTTSEFSNDTVKWHLGRLLTASVASSAPQTPDIVRHSAFSYEEQTGEIASESVEPGTEFEVITTYQRDGVGNIITKTVKGANLPPRITRTVFDAPGRFPVAATNPLGHKTRLKMNPLLAQPDWVEDANGLRTDFLYDGLGRVLQESEPDGTSTVTRYFPAGPSSPAGTAYQIVQKSDGAAPAIAYFDILARPIREESVSGDGRKVLQDTEYDARGWTSRQSRKYFFGNARIWTNFTYDARSRKTAIIESDGAQTLLTYQGLTTAVQNPLNQITSSVQNVRGWEISVTDNLGNLLGKNYDAVGNLLRTDAAGSITTMTYDVVGRQKSINDPDTGLTQYSHNALGELTSQTDAKGQVKTWTYDFLGRNLTRTEPEGTTTWQYDTGTGAGIGKLASIASPGGYHEIHIYDFLSRPVSTDTMITGRTYTSSVDYDYFGRPEIQTYPSGFQTRNHFALSGALSRVSTPDGSLDYWHAESYNAEGNVTREIFGNGSKTVKQFDAVRNHLRLIETTGPGGAAPLGNLQNLHYQFDVIGNLQQRQDLRQSRTETLTYDGLNRLKTSTLNGEVNLSLTYQPNGNVASKSGVGTYFYGSRPHAVTGVSGAVNASFAYDANGNRISGNGQTITHNSFNKPAAINSGGISQNLEYGASYELTHQVELTPIGSKATSYVGSGYERIEEDDTPASPQTITRIKHVHYIFGSDGAKAIVTQSIAPSGDSNEITYLHKDHLGSVDTLSGASGTADARFSYDAFGQRRSTDWSASAPLAVNSPTERGYTGHRHLGETSLIHMGGRVYDSLVGNFVSADPFVQAPSNLQSFNRYSYVFGNPLSYTDPSGFFGNPLAKAYNYIKDHKVEMLLNPYQMVHVELAKVSGVKALENAGKWVYNNRKAIIAIEIAVDVVVLSGGAGGAGVSAAFGGGAGGSFLGSVAVGSASSGLTTALYGGGAGAIAKSTLTGGLTAAMFFGIGSTGLTDGSAGKIALHGTAGGISSKMSGGNFKSGFVSAAFNEALSPRIDAFIPGDGFMPYAGRVGASAIVGGTTSSLSGGNFRNGAITAAFARMYNTEAHKEKSWAFKAGEFLREMGVTPDDLRQVDLYAQQAADAFNYAESVVSHDLDSAKQYMTSMVNRPFDWVYEQSPMLQEQRRIRERKMGDIKAQR